METQAASDTYVIGTREVRTRDRGFCGQGSRRVFRLEGIVAEIAALRITALAPREPGANVLNQVGETATRD